MATYFKQPRLAILPGFDVIPESDIYKVSDIGQNGVMTLMYPPCVLGHQWERLKIRFTIVSSWTKDQFYAIDQDRLLSVAVGIIDEQLLDESFCVESIEFNH